MGAALSALPVFLLGCVLVLLGFQFRLAYLQAASTDTEWSGGTTTDLSTAATATGQLAAGRQQQQQVHAQHTATSQDHGVPETAKAAAVKRDTLVLYIHNEDDPIFRENFEYFLLAGVQENSRCGWLHLSGLTVVPEWFIALTVRNSSRGRGMCCLDVLVTQVAALCTMHLCSQRRAAATTQRCPPSTDTLLSQNSNSLSHLLMLGF